MKNILSTFFLFGLILSAISASATAKDPSAPLGSSPEMSLECNCPPQTPPVSQQQEIPLVPLEEEMLVIEIPNNENPFMVSPLAKLLDKPISASGDEMNILFSTQEKITLNKGKITDYFCVKGLSSPCRVKMDYAYVIKDMSGIVKGANDKPVMAYTNTIYGLTDASKAVPPDAVFMIDGIPVKVEYKDRHFVISRAD